MKTASIIAGNVAGKVLGVGRELVLAYFLGTTGAADAFRVSLAAALVPTHFFMGDVLEGAFIPLYARRRLVSDTSARRLLRAVTVYLVLTSLIVVVLISLAGSQVIHVIAPGLSPKSADLAARMLKWMSIGIPLYVLGHLGALRALTAGRVVGVAARQPLLNLGFIVSIPMAAAFGRAEWIGAGFTIAFVVYALVIAAELRRLPFRPAAAGDVIVDEASYGQEIKELFRASVPLMSVMILGQLLGLVDRVAASFVGVGAIASLEYARTFVEMPNTVVGAAVATMALSRFSHVPREEANQAAAALVLPLMSGAVITMSVLSAVAPELVSVVFKRGNFDSRAVQTVSLAVRGLSIGAPFLMGAYILHRVLTAQLRAAETVVPLGISVATAIVGNVLLVPFFGLLGVAAAMSLAQMLYCGVLARRLGLLQPLARRLLPWTLAIAATLAVRMLVPLASLPILARGVILGLAGGALALLACTQVAATRADIRSLLDHVTRLLSQARTRLERRAA